MNHFNFRQKKLLSLILFLLFVEPSLLMINKKMKYYVTTLSSVYINVSLISRPGSTVILTFSGNRTDNKSTITIELQIDGLRRS